jgi:HlyD family secretion protein
VIQQESNQAKRVAEARATIEQERLNWEDAQREYARGSELFEKGFVARKELENIEKTRSNAKIKYDLAKRQLLLTLGGNQALYARYLTRDLSNPEADEFTLYAPIAGTVIEVKISEGEIVSSGTSTVTGGTTLMRIADLSQMRVETKINEVNISQVREGQAAEVRLDAIPDRLYHGKVVKISPKGEKVNNVVTYEVIIGLLESDPRLMPSMTANVDIILHVAKQVLYLPLMAITREGGKDSVIIRLPDGTGQTRPIHVALKNETVAVVDEGVQEGNQILLQKTGNDTKTGREGRP